MSTAFYLLLLYAEVLSVCYRVSQFDVSVSSSIFMVFSDFLILPPDVTSWTLLEFSSTFRVVFLVSYGDVSM